MRPNAFPKSARLHRAGEFAEVRREGKAFHCRHFVLSVHSRSVADGPARVGIITSRRVGNAVTRSRARRRLREIFRTSRNALRKGLWLVLIAKTSAAEAEFTELRAEWLRLGTRASIFKNHPDAPEQSAPSA